MPKRPRLIDIECEINIRTKSAVLVDVGGKERVWLPLSQIEVSEDGSSTVITLPEWMALEKGLI